MKTWVLILPLALAFAGCKKSQQQNTMELQALIDDSCAQNPVSFLEQEQSAGQQLYVFGPQDAAFRQEWQSLQKSFHDSGRDLSGSEKLAFVSRYVPRFLQSCTQFFARAVSACSRHAVGSKEMPRCLEPYNAEFRQHLTRSLKADEKGWIDLESIPAEL